MRGWAAVRSSRFSSVWSLGVEWIRYDSDQRFAGDLYGLYFGAQAP